MLFRMEHAILAGHSLFGSTHAVLVPVVMGMVRVPKRARPTMCGLRRVMVTQQEFQPDHPMSCGLCRALYPTEDT